MTITPIPIFKEYRGQPAQKNYGGSGLDTYSYAPIDGLKLALAWRRQMNHERNRKEFPDLEKIDSPTHVNEDLTWDIPIIIEREPSAQYAVIGKGNIAGALMVHQEMPGMPGVRLLSYLLRSPHGFSATFREDPSNRGRNLYVARVLTHYLAQESGQFVSAAPNDCSRIKNRGIAKPINFPETHSSTLEREHQTLRLYGLTRTLEDGKFIPIS